MDRRAAIDAEPKTAGGQGGAVAAAANELAPVLWNPNTAMYGELLFKRLQATGTARGNEISTGIG